jgi:hypothetical protein
MNGDQAAALRKPFDKSQIGKLPKGGVMLSFVGHAAATDRLLQVDPSWTWEPVAFTERGLPALDEFGGLWIRLTVCAVTRLGYGDAGGKKGPNAIKEAIGDALRNAALRFGVAIDLWAKEDLTAVDQHPPSNPVAPEPQAGPLLTAKNRVMAAAHALGWDKTQLTIEYSKIGVLADASVADLEDYAWLLEADIARAAKNVTA